MESDSGRLLDEQTTDETGSGLQLYTPSILDNIASRLAFYVNARLYCSNTLELEMKALNDLGLRDLSSDIASHREANVS